MSDQCINELARRAWRLHTEAVDEPWLAKPSAPVLYFGDLRAFKTSSLRVATVALNPSRKEFPLHAPFSRFPEANVSDIRAYLLSLDAYFRTLPYNEWFGFYEQALSGLEASYYGQATHTAVHTDIGSVLASDPTWNRLDRHVRERIANCGIRLWHRLIAYLEPQLILWSTAASWLNLIELAPDSCWKDLRTFRETKTGTPRKRSIVVRARWYRLAKEARVLVAFIPAAQKPLARLSHSQKIEAGDAISNFWRGRIERP